MPKDNAYLASVLPKFYRRQNFDVLLFGFVDAYKLCFPSVTILEIVTAFLKRYGISRDLVDVDTCISIYMRTQKDFRESEQTHGQ